MTNFVTFTISIPRSESRSSVLMRILPLKIIKCGSLSGFTTLFKELTSNGFLARMEPSKRGVGKSLDSLASAAAAGGTAVAAAAAAAAADTVQQENDILLGRLAAVQQVSYISNVSDRRIHIFVCFCFTELNIY